ncbi:hypothetical protein GCM10009548_03180 [Streptomyces malaysiensis subsp. malaysiensis]
MHVRLRRVAEPYIDAWEGERSPVRGLGRSPGGGPGRSPGFGEGRGGAGPPQAAPYAVRPPPRANYAFALADV